MNQKQTFFVNNSLNIMKANLKYSQNLSVLHLYCISILSITKNNIYYSFSTSFSTSVAETSTVRPVSFLMRGMMITSLNNQTPHIRIARPRGWKTFCFKALSRPKDYRCNQFNHYKRWFAWYYRSPMEVVLNSAKVVAPWDEEDRPDEDDTDLIQNCSCSGLEHLCDTDTSIVEDRYWEHVANGPSQQPGLLTIKDHLESINGILKPSFWTKSNSSKISSFWNSDEIHGPKCHSQCQNSIDS